MRRLFVPPGSLESSEVLITGPDFHHLVHVLRVKSGEPITLLDGEGSAREAVIETITRRDLIARVTGPASIPPHPPMNVIVAQAIGKGDRLERVIQHGTEAGAVAFIPLITSRTLVRTESQGAGERLERWIAIAKGAAEQSGRARIPDVDSPRSLASLISDFTRFSLVLLLDASGAPLPRILDGRTNVEESPCLVLVGPEGGFSREEVEAARSGGAIIASLGPFILRTETAALVAISQLMFWAAGENGWSTPVST